MHDIDRPLEHNPVLGRPARPVRQTERPRRPRPAAAAHPTGMLAHALLRCSLLRCFLICCAVLCCVLGYGGCAPPVDYAVPRDADGAKITEEGREALECYLLELRSLAALTDQDVAEVQAALRRCVPGMLCTRNVDRGRGWGG